MKLQRVDTEQAYQILWEKITSLELAPGEPLDISELSSELDLAQASIKEALRILIHEHLVDAPPRKLFVTELHFSDLEKISTIRLNLETLAAQQAARHATPDDLIILESLCKEETGDTRELFELDQKFHRAIAQAAHNQYLADTLKHFYGLSKRLWFLALPYLDFLPSAVKSHIHLVDAIESQNEPLAMDIMGTHIEEFYQKIAGIIQEQRLLEE
ncbi:MAG: GntR family transcriptional regulator [Anaerolineales bacterium]|nr:GntR family transcriptional regulator [Anaerolineales bacterium]